VSQAAAALALALVTGLVYCFFGYRVIKLLIVVTGFVLAGAVAAVLAGWASNANQLYMVVGLIVGGVAGAFALFFVFYAGVFLLGFLGFALIAYRLPLEDFMNASPLVVLGVGAVGGVIALLVERPILILATAAIGAWLSVGTMAYMVMGSESLEVFASETQVNTEQWFLFAFWALMTLAGAFTQMSMGKRPQKSGPATK
jgi:hypothetical protein